jgi:hypothetical protein
MMQYYIPNAYDVLKEYIDLYNEIIDKGSDNSYAQSILQYSYIRNDTLKNIIVFLDINYDKLVHAVDFSALVIELHNVVCILCNDIKTYKNAEKLQRVLAIMEASIITDIADYVEYEIIKTSRNIGGN